MALAEQLGAILRDQFGIKNPTGSDYLEALAFSRHGYAEGDLYDLAVCEALSDHLLDIKDSLNGNWTVSYETRASRGDRADITLSYDSETGDVNDFIPGSLPHDGSEYVDDPILRISVTPENGGRTITIEVYEHRNDDNRRGYYQGTSHLEDTDILRITEQAVYYFQTIFTKAVGGSMSTLEGDFFDSIRAYLRATEPGYKALDLARQY